MTSKIGIRLINNTIAAYILTKIAVTKTRPSSGVKPTIDIKGSINFAKNSMTPETSNILTINTKGIKILYNGMQISLISTIIFLAIFCIH